MDHMFGGCYSLESIDLTSFNTDSVTNMTEMFWGDNKLKSIDLSSFNTANVTDMNEMFTYCTGLTTIYAGDGWNTDAVTSAGRMFTGCVKLVGGMGTHYDGNYVELEYARIDGGPARPGYLTGIPAFIVGDMNGDRIVDIDDVTILIDFVLMGGVNTPAADVNGDEKVDIDDVTSLINFVLTGAW